MALGATIYTFEIRLADSDRQVYETLNLKLAQHPSETAEFLWTRVLAYCLEYSEGLAFSKGISDTDMPALFVRDLTGAWISWIEVGAPEAARLHKAAKTAPRVAIYLHRDPALLIARWANERIHRSEHIQLRALDPAFLDQLSRRLERRMSFDLSVADNEIYLSLGETTLTCSVRHLHMDGSAG